MEEATVPAGIWNGARLAPARSSVRSSVSTETQTSDAVDPLASREARYNEAISLMERAHRNFLEVIKLELEGLGIHDINNVQGLMLFNIGDAEMTVGELTLRGCYLGSNVSYNVKKMVENGYLEQERSVHDRRSIHVRLTDKGRALCEHLNGMHRRHIEMLGQTPITEPDMQTVITTLRRLERFWVRASDLAQRPGQRAA